MKFLQKVLRKLLPIAVIASVALALVYLPDIVPERYTELATFFGNERARQGLVGYTVAAVRYGRQDMVGAWGTDARGIPLESFTPMAAGELSMAVTGFLAYVAEGEGKIDPGKPLSEIFPDQAFRAGERGSAGPGGAATLRNLLSHTGGWSSRDLDDRHASGKALEASLRLLTRTAPRTRPGEAYGYLETGYQVLGLALERAYKLPFAELAAKKVFLPLKMMQSDAQGGEAASRLPEGSTAFFWTAVPKAQPLPPAQIPSSGMITTAPDFARLMEALIKPAPGRQIKGGPSALARLTTPLARVGGWTYGWQLRELRSGPELLLEADSEAFSSIAAIWPERQAAIVIMAPESGIFLSKAVLPALLDGARNILLSESTEPPLPLGRFSILFAVIASVHLIMLAGQTGNSLSWARAVRGRADATGRPFPITFARLRLAVGFAVRLLLALVLPLLASIWLGPGSTWTYLFDREPGIAGWVAIALFLGMIRNVSRFSWLRTPASQVRKIRLLLRK